MANQKYTDARIIKKLPNDDDLFFKEMDVCMVIIAVYGIAGTSAWLLSTILMVLGMFVHSEQSDNVARSLGLAGTLALLVLIVATIYTLARIVTLGKPSR